MATTVPGRSFISVPAFGEVTVQSSVAASTGRRRRTPREAGQALEILGHAIEYLTDEFALECMSGPRIFGGARPIIEAIEILKACNRDVYLSCPVVPTLGQRLHSLLGLRSL